MTVRRVNDLPIRSKFTLLYILGVLLPIAVLLAVYVLTNTAAEIRARETLNARQSLEAGRIDAKHAVFRCGVAGKRHIQRQGPGAGFSRTV